MSIAVTTDVDIQVDFLRAHLEKPIIIVGLMGAGKTSIGKMLAERLGYEFVDSDDQIILREKRPVSEIFKQSGEPYFRKVEREVIADLMKDNTPHVIGTGGGAFMDDETRKTIINSDAVSVFLKAKLDVLLERVGDGEGRPLLEAGDPETILQDLIEKRYPVYSDADLTIPTYSETLEQTTDRVIDALYNELKLA